MSSLFDREKSKEWSCPNCGYKMSIWALKSGTILGEGDSNVISLSFGPGKALLVEIKDSKYCLSCLSKIYQLKIDEMTTKQKADIWAKIFNVGIKDIFDFCPGHIDNSIYDPDTDKKIIGESLIETTLNTPLEA